MSAIGVAAPAVGTTTAAAIDCRDASLGFAGPLTGRAAFLGQEQASWSKFAAAQYRLRYGRTFRFVLGDTQLSPKLAGAVGRQFVANENVLGVIGPSTSQGAVVSVGLFRAAELAAVSGSATRADLARPNLSGPGGLPTFFRVVPNDLAQAPSIVDFVVRSLGAKRVVVLDSQDEYSMALARGLAYRFGLEGVTLGRRSVSAKESDFSSVAGRVGSGVQVVVFATRNAPAAQALSDELRGQGKRAVVLATDGAYSPSQFKPRLGYVSSFAPDLRLVPGGAAVVAAYNTWSRSRSFGTFGPPSYMAAWVLMRAIDTACRDGAATRAEVTANVRRTNVPSILGGRLHFTKKGEAVGAAFAILKVTNGKYALAAEGSR